MYSGRPVYSPVTALAVPHGISNPVLDLFEYSTSHGVPSMPSCGMVPYRGVIHIARVWINRVREPILHVVS